MIAGVYAGVRFCFELLCLVIAAYWGWTRTDTGVWRVLLAVAAPGALALVWGTWVAPRAPYELGSAGRILVEVAVYVVVALALSQTRFSHLTWYFVVAAGVIAAPHPVLGQRPIPPAR